MFAAGRVSNALVQVLASSLRPPSADAAGILFVRFTSTVNTGVPRGRAIAIHIQFWWPGVLGRESGVPEPRPPPPYRRRPSQRISTGEWRDVLSGGAQVALA